MSYVYVGSAAWPRDAAGAARGAVVVIGNFDGVHRGHRAVLARANALAADRALACVVYTFDPAPTSVVAPQRHQPRISTLADRVARLAAAGADAVVIEPFTAAWAAHPARWFAEEVLGRRLGARAVIVGHDFRFGANRAGDAASLRAWMPALDVIEVPAYESDGSPISSSRVRRLVAEGDVASAAELLGRPHELVGTVVQGDQRGRTIGFPTANLLTETELTPADGVYAGTVRVDDGPEILPAVTNVGVRPTVDGGGRRTIEVHLLDWQGDLYGRALRFACVARLRGERRFPSIDALRAQIVDDVAAARRVLG